MLALSEQSDIDYQRIPRVFISYWTFHFQFLIKIIKLLQEEI